MLHMKIHKMYLPVLGFSGKRAGSSSTSGMRSRTTPLGSRVRAPSGHQTDSSPSGGLSVTGSLSDFSLFVFHPYGGGSKKTTLQALENSFRRGKGELLVNLDVTNSAESLLKPIC